MPSGSPAEADGSIGAGSCASSPIKVSADNVDTMSTVSKFVQSHGSAALALKRYIASFGAAAGKTELGSQPPSKTYRLLRVLAELASEEERALRSAESKQMLAATVKGN